jgi:hypothetical protein
VEVVVFTPAAYQTPDSASAVLHDLSVSAVNLVAAKGRAKSLYLWPNHPCKNTKTTKRTQFKKCKSPIKKLTISPISTFLKNENEPNLNPFFFC